MAGTSPILAAYKDTTMSTERFDDEILSTIIDGEADQELVASVAADPTASARLEQLRAAVSAVKAPIPEATPERRAASIAAAMAAATPAAEVSSLAAARHTRTEQTRTRRLNPRWAAAAAILLVVAIPLLVRATNSESADFASSSDDSTSFASADVGTEDSSEDAADSSDTAASADDEAALEAESGNDATTDDSDVEESAPVAAEEATDSADGATGSDDSADEAANAFRLADAQVVNSVEVLEDLISLDTIVPELTAEQLIAEGVAPECLEALDVEGSAAFALAFLDPFGGGRRLILIAFNADEPTTMLDAEDCSPLG
jgi:hypothetical protein